MYLNTSMQKLTDMTDKRLKEINERVADISLGKL